MKRINQPYYTNQECPVFPSIQHSSGNIGWYIKLEQAISVKIVVPSTALLYSAYKKKKTNARWFGSGLCNRNAPFYCARGVSELLNR